MTAAVIILVLVVFISYYHKRLVHTVSWQKCQCHHFVTAKACSHSKLHYCRRKDNQQQSDNHTNYNIYSETPANRKLVKSRVFKTQLSDENANVVPPVQNGAAPTRFAEAKAPTKGNPVQAKTPKNSYDRIKLGKIRWRLPKKKTHVYADINDMPSIHKQVPLNNSRLVKRIQDNYENTKPLPNTSDYENPDTFVLQVQSSYENISVAPSEIVMQENNGVYQSVETTA